MAHLCTRLRVLQVNLWLVALVTGGISADKNTRNSTDSECPSVQQQPRYVAAKKNMPVHFLCYSQDAYNMQWYKMTVDNKDFCELLPNNPRYSIKWTENFVNLTIFRVTSEDNGVYVCDRRNITADPNETNWCGTELKVLGYGNIKQIQNRNTLKDAIIIIQSILLVIFISIPILFFLDKGEDKKSPEEDHTYEGLEVEQMATYEDITPFRDMKAKWTVGEHPGEE
ncbi:PREDICTED: B-cell antigen receptor complex-associated protein beta chain [Acanthisitta chloris]|uniref:B-cell antigen receptor complex-associated protein beta chain n=1 Tax=Acanthisitta chloris TaxID=57068 RepID=UPI0004F0E566|nr:PREDICTED: B-cell antigen receptor complex-associated protein beta chain [Acanthisitta chloris]